MSTSTELLYQKYGQAEVKMVYSIACLVTGATAIGLLSGLIYYEVNMNDRTRTLINRIYTLLLSYLVTLLIIVNLNDILRPNVGPLPVMVCKLYIMSVQGFLMALCMGLIEAIVIKYIYCCILKSFGGLDDDFYFYFFVIVNGLLFVYMIGFMMFANMIPVGPLGHCCGFNPEKILQPIVYQSVVPFPILAMWLVLIIHIPLQYEITKVETCLAREITKKKIIMTGWLNNAIHFMYVSFFSVFLILMDRLRYESKNDLNLPRPIGNIVCLVGILAYSYLTHPHIRTLLCKKTWWKTSNVPLTP